MSALPDERPDILSGTQVSVNFRGLKALQQVDIQVPEGAIVGLVGPNGAGKSTLLGVLSGDVVARQGTVRLGGQDVSGLAPEARVRHGLARTFQLPELFDELTVREHLTLPRRLARHRPARGATRSPAASCARTSPRTRRSTRCWTAWASRRSPARRPGPCRSGSAAWWRSRGPRARGPG